MGWVLSAAEGSEGVVGLFLPSPWAALAACVSPGAVVQAKVRELEEKCRSQSEQFNLLSQELERFRQQAGKIDLLSSPSVPAPELPGPPGKALAQLMNGIATSLGKGKGQLTFTKVSVCWWCRSAVHRGRRESAPLSVLGHLYISEHLFSLH